MYSFYHNIHFKLKLQIQMIFFTLLVILLTSTYELISIDLKRFPSYKLTKMEQITCQPLSNNFNFIQPCYLKDISYSIRVYIQKQPKYLSIDLTSPVSWVKDHQCKQKGSDFQCKKLALSLRTTVTHIIEDIQEKVVSKKRKQSNITVHGMSDQITGKFIQNERVLIMRTVDDVSTWAFNVLFLGVFIFGQNELVDINASSLLIATEVSKNIDSLMDGAITTRIPSSNQKSFLIQIINSWKVNKIVCIKLMQNKIDIGQYPSLQFDVNDEQLHWQNLVQFDDYGLYPVIKGIEIMTGDSEQIEIEDPSKYLTIFTLSASYISLPQQILTPFLTKLHVVGNCSISNSSYVTCSKLKNAFNDATLLISFQNKTLAFTMKELTIKKQKKQVTINIRKSLMNNSIVFGEPFFKKYIYVIDYTNNKIGIAYMQLSEPIMRGIIAARLAYFLFLFCCVFVCFGQQLRQLYKFIFMYPIKPIRNVQKKSKPYESIPQDDTPKISN